MGLDFQSAGEFAIKVNIGGVNAISGVLSPYAQQEAGGHRVQDYVVTPGQQRLDGMVSGDGQVKQFIAMPMGDGYTVEARTTGQEITGGLQLEITPLRQAPKLEIFVEAQDWKTSYQVQLDMTAVELASSIEKQKRIPSTQFKLSFGGCNLDDGQSNEANFWFQFLTKLRKHS